MFQWTDTTCEFVLMLTMKVKLDFAKLHICNQRTLVQVSKQVWCQQVSCLHTYTTTTHPLSEIPPQSLHLSTACFQNSQFTGTPVRLQRGRLRDLCWCRYRMCVRGWSWGTVPDTFDLTTVCSSKEHLSLESIGVMLLITRIAFQQTCSLHLLWNLVSTISPIHSWRSS